MASRVVAALLTLDGVQGVITGFKKAGAGAVEYANVAHKSGDKAMAWVGKHQSELDKVGGSLLKVGAVGVLALGGLAKSAIDWESAWAGVTKTVDGTPDQMAALEQSLRDLTKVLPASHSEIAAVAEAAGQLGVKVDSIEAFTRTMIDLGETTNLSADEAATSLAQLMNIMGTSTKDVNRLGSAVVALGNNGASTERDIVSMAQRLAAAGNQAGMSEADVLAFASALSSVGVEAEAGGSAVSLTFKQMGAAVRNGGADLDLIAKTSGMSAEEFRRAWQDDAAGAVASFVEGLGQMQSSGEDVNGVLAELGMTGLRQTDALVRLAGATKAAGTEQDLLREALGLSAQAWDENSALADEAAQRYETRAAKAQIALNSIRDEAISLGQMLLPVFDTILSTVGNLVDAFSALPDPLKNVGIMVAVVGTAGALAAGGILKLVTAVVSAKTGLQALGITAKTATLSMGAIGLALTAAGYVLSAWSGQQAEAEASTSGFTAAIKEQGGALTEATRAEAASQALKAGALDVAKELGVALEDVTEAILGNEDAYRRVTTAIDAEIAALESEIQAKITAGEYTGDLTEEQRRLQSVQQELTGAVDKLNGSYRKSVEEMTVLDAATGGTAASAEEAAAAAQLHAEAEQQRALDLDKVREAMEDAVAAAQTYANALLALSGSQMGMDSSVLDLTEHLAELSAQGDASAYTLDTTTRAGLANQRLLDSLAQSTMRYIETLYEQGSSTQEIARATRDARLAWIDARVAMGGAREESEELSKSLFAIPKTVATTVALPGARLSQKEAEDLNAALDGLPDEVKSEIIAEAQEAGFAAAKSKLDALSRDRTVNVRVNQIGGEIVIRPTVRGGGRGISINSADGNILDYYRDGGVRESHVAQIAPAGAWRVWAEPETGGESYIPLAPAKRARSLDIWHETGRRLGVQGFRDGGMYAPSRSLGMAAAAAAPPAGPVYARIAPEDIDLICRTAIGMSQSVSARTVDGALLGLGRGV